MKVLFVSSGNAKNGINPIVQNQGQSLIDQGITTDYFTIKGKGLISYANHIFRLRSYLKKNKYTIIHAHYGFCGIVSFLAKRKEKIVVSFMGSDLIGIVNHKGKMSLLGLLESVINKVFAKFFFDYNIVKSNNLKRALFRNTESQIIPNGINFTKFYPIEKACARKELNISKEMKIVLFPANPKRPEKNFKLAENAVKLFSDSNVALKVVYDISQELLNMYYNAADVILLTSFHEGSPNVIKEALACNCVIVSTDVGDVRQNMQNIEGCFICSLDPKDVAGKLSMAFNFENFTGRKIITNLSSDLIALKIINIYNHILD